MTPHEDLMTAQSHRALVAEIHAKELADPQLRAEREKLRTELEIQYDGWPRSELGKINLKLREQLIAIRADGDLQNRRAKLDRVFAELRELYRQDSLPIRRDLESVGVRVESTFAISDQHERFKDAIPVLLTHLSMPYLERTREGLARSLGTPYARDVWPQLVVLYRAEKIAEGARSDAKEGLAVALAGTVTAETLPELIELIRDATHGPSRVLLLSGARRFRSQIVKDAISELSHDPDLKIQIEIYRKSDAVRLKKTTKKGKTDGE